MSHPQPGSLPPVTVHLDAPSVARVFDYYLGGTTNWEVDRAFADQVLDRFPLMRGIALTHRIFLNRVVRYLARRGVKQFLDIGSGVVSTGATHNVADQLAVHERRRPNTRVVYVDNDPIAVAHSELSLDENGDRRRHAVIRADLRDPEDLWLQALSTELLDPNQPVALLLIAVLHLDQPDAAGNEIGPSSVTKLRELLPFGSYVAVSHVTDEGIPDDVRVKIEGLKRIYDAGGSGSVTWRSHADIQSMLGDLRMVEPGWISATEWRPEETGPSAPKVSAAPSSTALIWAGLGQKV